MPSVIPQTPLNISGLPADRNAVTVGQPVLRHPPSTDNKGIHKEAKTCDIMNMVNAFNGQFYFMSQKTHQEKMVHLILESL